MQASFFFINLETLWYKREVQYIEKYIVIEGRKIIDHLTKLNNYPGL